MVTSASVRLTIKTQGKPRAIASLFERHNGPCKGDLIINMRPGQQNRSGLLSTLSSPEQDKAFILEQRYSIYQSPNSAENINVITYIQRLSVGDPISERHHTFAIKSGERFAPVYIRRFGPLGGRRFEINGTAGRNISLGRVNTDAFSLVMGIFVSDRRLRLTGNEDDYNMMDIEFTSFRVSVLWSFIPLRAYPSSMSYLWRTRDPRIVSDEGEKALHEEIMKGYTAREAIEKFKIMREYLKIAMITLIKADYEAIKSRPTPNQLRGFADAYRMATARGYFKRGVIL
jgi:hypothetical protein